jgi:hypothetical protein
MPATGDVQKCGGKFVYGKLPNYTRDQIGSTHEFYYCDRCGQSNVYTPKIGDPCPSHVTYYEHGPSYDVKRGSGAGWYVSDNGYYWKTFY